MNAIQASAEQMARAFNEWMRRYTEQPETFAHEWRTISQFIAEKKSGAEPSYGESCTQFLMSILEQQMPADQAK